MQNSTRTTATMDVLLFPATSVNAVPSRHIHYVTYPKIRQAKRKSDLDSKKECAPGAQKPRLLGEWPAPNSPKSDGPFRPRGRLKATSGPQVESVQRTINPSNPAPALTLPEWPSPTKQAPRIQSVSASLIISLSLASVACRNSARVCPVAEREFFTVPNFEMLSRWAQFKCPLIISLPYSLSACA